MKKSNSLKDRLKKSYESKDRGAGTRPSAMNWKLVEDIKFYKPKEGKNKIDIIPYVIKTKNDPLVKTGDAKVGDQSYMLDLWIHSNIGPTQAQIICNKENFNKPCPICEQRQQFYNEGKKNEAGALKAKRQCFYNVREYEKVVKDKKETWAPSDEITIFNISHFLFEKELIEEAKASSDDGGIIDFVDIDEGKSIIFRAAKTESVINEKSVNFLEYKSFSFVDRKNAIDESWLEKAVSFDELMILNTYDEAKKILFGDEDDDSDNDDEEDDEDEKPVKSKTKKPMIEDSDNDDEDSDDDTNDNEDEDSDDEEDDDEPTPKAKAKPIAKKVTIGKPVTVLKCPHKHKFGIDCEKKEECDDCDDWADCKKENRKLKAK